MFSCFCCASSRPERTTSSEQDKKGSDKSGQHIRPAVASHALTSTFPESINRQNGGERPDFGTEHRHREGSSHSKPSMPLSQTEALRTFSDVDMLAELLSQLSTTRGGWMNGLNQATLLLVEQLGVLLLSIVALSPGGNTYVTLSAAGDGVGLLDIGIPKPLPKRATHRVSQVLGQVDAVGHIHSDDVNQGEEPSIVMLWREQAAISLNMDEEVQASTSLMQMKDWRTLHQLFGYSHFQAVPIRAGNLIVGALSVVLPFPPSSRSARQLSMVSAFLAQMMQDPGLGMTTRLLEELSLTGTVDSLVKAVACGVVGYCRETMYIVPQCRIALVRDDVSAAAIFEEVPGKPKGSSSISSETSFKSIASDDFSPFRPQNMADVVGETSFNRLISSRNSFNNRHRPSSSHNSSNNALQRDMVTATSHKSLQMLKEETSATDEIGQEKRNDEGKPGVLDHPLQPAILLRGSPDAISSTAISDRAKSMSGNAQDSSWHGRANRSRRMFSNRSSVTRSTILDKDKGVTKPVGASQYHDVHQPAHSPSTSLKFHPHQSASLFTDVPQPSHSPSTSRKFLDMLVPLPYSVSNGGRKTGGPYLESCTSAERPRPTKNYAMHGASLLLPHTLLEKSISRQSGLWITDCSLYLQNGSHKACKDVFFGKASKNVLSLAVTSAPFVETSTSTPFVENGKQAGSQFMAEMSDTSEYSPSHKMFSTGSQQSRTSVDSFLVEYAAGGRSGNQSHRGHSQKPYMGVYIVFSTPLPGPLLKAMIEKVDILLMAVMPIVTQKLLKDMLQEWEYLHDEVLDSDVMRLESSMSAVGMPPALDMAQLQVLDGPEGAAAIAAVAAAMNAGGGDTHAPAAALAAVTAAMANQRPLDRSASQSSWSRHSSYKALNVSLEDKNANASRHSFNVDHGSTMKDSVTPMFAAIHDKLRTMQARLMKTSTVSRKEELCNIILFDVLGTGGFGTVYRGTYDDTEVAVKVISSVHGGDAKDVRDALELAVLSNINHPNIVQVIAHFTSVSVVRRSVLEDAKYFKHDKTISRTSSELQLPEKIGVAFGSTLDPNSVNSEDSYNGFSRNPMDRLPERLPGTGTGRSSSHTAPLPETGTGPSSSHTAPLPESGTGPSSSRTAPLPETGTGPSYSHTAPVPDSGTRPFSCRTAPLPETRTCPSSSRSSPLKPRASNLSHEPVQWTNMSPSSSPLFLPPQVSQQSHERIRPNPTLSPSPLVSQPSYDRAQQHPASPPSPHVSQPSYDRAQQNSALPPSPYLYQHRQSSVSTHSPRSAPPLRVSIPQSYDQATEPHQSPPGPSTATRLSRQSYLSPHNPASRASPLSQPLQGSTPSHSPPPQLTRHPNQQSIPMQTHSRAYRLSRSGLSAYAQAQALASAALRTANSTEAATLAPAAPSTAYSTEAATLASVAPSTAHSTEAATLASDQACASTSHNSYGTPGHSETKPLETSSANYGTPGHSETKPLEASSGNYGTPGHSETKPLETSYGKESPDIGVVNVEGNLDGLARFKDTDGYQGFASDEKSPELGYHQDRNTKNMAPKGRSLRSLSNVFARHELIILSTEPGLLPLTNVNNATAICMELCDMGTLGNAIKKGLFHEPVKGAPGPNYKFIYMCLLEVALAIRHLHNLNLVHCDIKPANVLLKSSPRDPRGFICKLSDFGLVKMLMEDSEGRKSITKEKDGAGTMTHMAPELLIPEVPASVQVDIFSFGIVMWQLVSAKPVFYPGISYADIRWGVAYDGLRPAFPYSVAPDYRRLCELCWSTDPADRPSVSQLISTLRNLLKYTKQMERSARRHSEFMVPTTSQELDYDPRPQRKSHAGKAEPENHFKTHPRVFRSQRCKSMGRSSALGLDNIGLRSRLSRSFQVRQEAAPESDSEDTLSSEEEEEVIMIGNLLESRADSPCVTNEENVVFD